MLLKRIFLKWALLQWMFLKSMFLNWMCLKWMFLKWVFLKRMLQKWMFLTALVLNSMFLSIVFGPGLSLAARPRASEARQTPRFYRRGALVPPAFVAMPYCEVGVIEGLAVRGGFLKEPVFVPNDSYQGHVFVRLRQYDDWLTWMVCKESRRKSPLRSSVLWQTLLAASSSREKQAEVDPLADIMDTMDDFGAPLKKRSRQRASPKKEALPPKVVRTIEYEEKPGSSEMRTITILQNTKRNKHTNKTVWLCREDLPWFVDTLFQEAHKKEPLVFTEGLRWMEGTHAWVANWGDATGEQMEQMYVLPFRIREGTKLPLEEAVFQAKKQQVKTELTEKIIGLGFPEHLLD